MGDHDESLVVAERVRAALQKDSHLGNQELSIAASIGIAVSSSTLRSAADLLRAADEAMYQAKRRGGDQVAVLDDSPIRD